MVAEQRWCPGTESDTGIFSPLLYRLSYLGFLGGFDGGHRHLASNCVLDHSRAVSQVPTGCCFGHSMTQACIPYHGTPD